MTSRLIVHINMNASLLIFFKRIKHAVYEALNLVPSASSQIESDEIILYQSRGSGIITLKEIA